MKNNIFKITITTLFLTTYVSCGGSMYGNDDDDDSSSNSDSEEQTQEGTFRGVANAVNSEVTSSNAAIQIKIDNGTFEAELFGLGPDSTPHKQYLRAGTECPDENDDTNNDGVIDATEGEAVYGARVLALDSDLITNGGTFPTERTYRYTESAPLDDILANLGISNLEVDGKVITIEGVPDSTTLPPTAQGAKADFPIACGEVNEVN